MAGAGQGDGPSRAQSRRAWLARAVAVAAVGAVLVAVVWPGALPTKGRGQGHGHISTSITTTPDSITHMAVDGSPIAPLAPETTNAAAAADPVPKQKQALPAVPLTPPMLQTPGEEEEPDAPDEDRPPTTLPDPRVPPLAPDDGDGDNGALVGVGEAVPPPMALAAMTCRPMTGRELQYLVENTTCTVILLAPSTIYVLTDFIRVRRPVTVIGRPLGMPTIDGSKTLRAFTVEPGGFLDLRAVRIFRGKPMRVLGRYFVEIRGGAVYVRRGGQAVITGCFLTVNPRLITEFLITRDLVPTIRMLGGYLLQEGGTLTVTDSHFYVTRPGVLFREVYTVGGHVLVLGGSAILTGCSFTSSLLFVNVMAVGDTVAVFGGLAIFTGCSFTFNCALAAAAGTGLMLFMGGGVAVLTGCSAASNIAAHSFFGAGGAIWVGGGVMVLTGVSFNGVVSLFIGAGVANIIGVGSGVLVLTGVSKVGNNALAGVAFYGNAIYVGSGTAVLSEVTFSRVVAITAYWGGAGGSLMVGAGAVTIVNTIGFIVNVIGYMAVQGGHVAVFAGWITMVNTFWYKFEAIIAHYGQGTEFLLNAGGAVFINTGYAGGAYFFFTGNPSIVKIWIAGHSVLLGNSTYQGALALRTGVTYFPARAQGPETQQQQWASTALTMKHVYLPDTALLQDAQDAASSLAALTPPWKLRADATVLRVTDGLGRAVRVLQTEDEPAISGAPFIESPGPSPAPSAAVASTKVVVAAPLDRCSLCDVGPGATATNIGGAGSSTCRLSDTCEDEAADEEEDVWWNPPPGFGPANTSVAVLRLRTGVVATGRRQRRGLGAGAAPAAATVLAALESVSRGLGLPQRYHARATREAADPLSLFDEPRAADPTDSATADFEGGEEDRLGDGSACAQEEDYLVYLVSDWQNVTKGHVQRLWTSDAGALLTAALREQLQQHHHQQAEGTGSELCDVRVVAATSLFVPGLPTPQEGATPFSLGREAAGSGVAVEDKDGLAGVFGWKWRQEARQHAGAAAGATAASVELLIDEGVAGVVVWPGATYTLRLRDFPPRRALTVRLLGMDGRPAGGGGLTGGIVGRFASRPEAATGTQEWAWTVAKRIRSGAYYLEVADAAAGMGADAGGAAVAFTQAFEVAAA